MRSLSAIDRIANYVTAIDHDIIHVTQEAIYFFFVVFLVELHLWPNSPVKYIVGSLILLLAFPRILYYLIPYFLQYRLARILSLEDRVAIVSAHECRSPEALEAVLGRYLKRLSAERLTQLLLRHDGGEIRYVMGAD